MQVLIQTLSFNEGNNIQTISEAKNVLSAASTVEDFPQNFGIYDLNEFLNVLGLVDVPNLTFRKRLCTHQ